MVQQKAILPTADITQAVSELMVELDIAEVDYHSILSTVLEGASVISPTNFYEPYDTVDNALSGMALEYSEVTMQCIPLDQVPMLKEKLCELAQKLHKRMMSCGLEGLNDKPEQLMPDCDIENTTLVGDMIVSINDNNY